MNILVVDDNKRICGNKRDVIGAIILAKSYRLIMFDGEGFDLQTFHEQMERYKAQGTEMLMLNGRAG